MLRPVMTLLEKRPVRQSLSVAVATGLYGLSFGALAVTAGLSISQTMVLSMVMFSGASQFALIGVVGAGGTALAAVASAALLGVRNGLYGLHNAPLLSRLPQIFRLLAAHLTIDESTAVAAAQPTKAESRQGFWLTGVAVWLLWNALTLVGALAGGQLGDPAAWGLDAAASAAFLGLLWPRLTGTADHPALAQRARLASVLAAIAALTLVPLTPPGIPVLGGLLGALVAGWLPQRFLISRSTVRGEA
ncbi:MAG: AzlC family ABC transporter permease [Bifidobacteriaceae bacterium]|jgi:predicted branched-subunit amino acid permease|nr:AzlC family ABC transporter permease [Bifidobacteriaceae bacterium]